MSMKNNFVNYIVAFSNNMLDMIMGLLLILSYLLVKILPFAVLTFWISVGIGALCKANGESEFMNMPIGRIALIGLVATIVAIVLGVAAITLLENNTENNEDTEMKG